MCNADGRDMRPQAIQRYQPECHPAAATAGTRSRRSPASAPAAATGCAAAARPAAAPGWAPPPASEAITLTLTPCHQDATPSATLAGGTCSVEQSCTEFADLLQPPLAPGPHTRAVQRQPRPPGRQVQAVWQGIWVKRRCIAAASAAGQRLRPDSHGRHALNAAKLRCFRLYRCGVAPRSCSIHPLTRKVSLKEDCATDATRAWYYR